MTKQEAPNKDKSLDVFVRYFEQADSIHREAWWVLTNERRPVGKSPFGKVQRALLASQDIKLTNKSMFSCDRYLVKRDVMGLQGYPQKAEIFEKCSEKIEAKKIAQFFAPDSKEIQATFFPENMEEILGLGATVLNKAIQCTLNGTEQGQLQKLKCKDWAQDRSKEQMIRLDVYDYEKAGRNLIKLRGKVYENLTDTRKIEADVPMEGKIYVTETELYPPEPTPAPKPSPTPSPKTAATPTPDQERAPGAPPMTLPPEGGAVQVTVPGEMPEGGEPPAITPLHLPPPRGQEGVDPDVMMQREQTQQEPVMQDHEMIEEPPQEGTLGAPPQQQPPTPEAGGVRAR
ncbi:hypothetical protein [Bdellovibrio sp. HCB-110]|uniref:hypothetical protein n=1 Tax=Bdellovibrio sp. HCB-110 TaxID=3391182 RepID=UPI0039B65E52